MTAVVDLPSEGMRQLDRARRLLDAQAAGPRGSRRPVHKALEQLFGEARGRSQAAGAAASALGASPFVRGSAFGAAGSSRLLQGPQSQRLDREIGDFSISAGGVASAGGKASPPAPAEEDAPGLSLAQFFGLRHEKVLLGVVEEAHRDALRTFERHSAGRVDEEWRQAKAQILAAMSPHRFPQAGGAPRRGASADLLAGGGAAPSAGGVLPAPRQDAAIIDAMEEGMSESLPQLSSESCPAFAGELMECWAIVSHLLEPSRSAGVRGALRYLQHRYAGEVRATVYRSADARLGGVPDAWAMLCAFGRVKFETATFPGSPEHVWYAVYVAARAGLPSLLLELPQKVGALAERCEMLQTICGLLARRLQSSAPAGPGMEDYTAAAEADRADVLRADLFDDGGPFHDVLVALLLGRSFAFGKLPEGTVEDWLWFRLHAVHHADDGDGGQGSEFDQQLEALQKQARSVPPAHYDPGPGGLPGVPGFGMRGDQGSSGLAAAGLGGQTLNFVKVLLLTLQFGRAIQQLRSQDRSLRGPAVHIAVVLHRAGTLERAALPRGSGEQAQQVNVAGLVCDYASQFSAGDRLRYFRLLDPPDRAEALERLLLQGGFGANDELLGCIDSNGRHRQGLLEQALLQARGGGVDAEASDRAEFVDLCARAGRRALEQGQYREALRLLHLGRCYGDVLQVLCRCLRLPVWHDATLSAAEEASALAQDIQRFYTIYERNLDRYALPSQAWAVARKLYAMRMFHSLCERGQPEPALDIFDREQLLPLAGEPRADGDDELVAEYPRLVANYVGILRHAASRQAPVAAGSLQTRVRQLQMFLAVHAHRLVLDQETTMALATLTLV